MTTAKSKHSEGRLRYIKRDFVRNRGIYIIRQISFYRNTSPGESQALSGFSFIWANLPC